MNLVIDRTFRGVDNQRWIVDYKTSSHEGADIDAFLGRERYMRHSLRVMPQPSEQRRKRCLDYIFRCLPDGASGALRSIPGKIIPLFREIKNLKSQYPCGILGYKQVHLEADEDNDSRAI